MSRSIRLDEDIYGVTDLRGSLPQVVDKATETKRPQIITRRGRPVAAIVDIGELQRLYDRIEELEESEDRRIIQDFEATEARGEVDWISNEEMSQFVDRVITEARERA